MAVAKSVESDLIVWHKFNAKHANRQMTRINRETFAQFAASRHLRYEPSGFAGAMPSISRTLAKSLILCYRYSNDSLTKNSSDH